MDVPKLYLHVFLQEKKIFGYNTSTEMSGSTSSIMQINEVHGCEGLSL